MHIIATINLKGGVGKSTITRALAEFLSAEHGQKVLCIDLDPQTNLTTMLIGETKWQQLNQQNHTLAALFQDALRDPNAPAVFDLNATLQRGVSPIAEVRKVDLLPSSLDLIEVQDRLGTMPPGRFFSNNPIELLNRATKKLVDEYDYVLIDCPPNLGLITMNGLRMADGYIIPTIPDVLSTYGIPQIQTRVKDFADEITETIAEIGIVISKYRAAATVHNNTIRRLQKDPKLPVVFDSWIPERNNIAQSAEHAKVSTLRQAYGYQGEYDAFAALAKEFKDEVDQLP